MAAKARPLIQFRTDEDLRMLNYLVNITPTCGPYKMWYEYKNATGSDRTVNSLYNRFTYTLAPKLHMVHIGLESKLKLYMKFSLKVNKTYLEKLKKYAVLTVLVDEYISDYHLLPGVNPSQLVNFEDNLTVPAPPPKPILVKTAANGGPPPNNTDTMRAFFVSMKDVIKESNRELLAEFTTAAAMGAMAQRNPPDPAPATDLPSSAQSFVSSIKTMANHMNAPELIPRIDVLAGKFNENEIPLNELQTALEFTLALLGC